MSAITWIVIILILVSILVTVTEVGLRFAMLERSKKPGQAVVGGAAPQQISWQQTGSQQSQTQPPPQLLLPSLPQKQDGMMPPSALEELAATLGLEGNATLEQVKEGIRGLQLHADCEAPVPVPDVSELK